MGIVDTSAGCQDCQILPSATRLSGVVLIRGFASQPRGLVCLCREGGLLLTADYAAQAIFPTDRFNAAGEFFRQC